MIADNLHRHGFNLFYPRIGWAGLAPGYVGAEFPLVPLLAALLYRIFGVQDWIGRVVSISFFAASLPLLFLLVKRVYGHRAALLAMAIYCAVPVGLFSARSFMSDTASLACALAAVWLFIQWLDRGRPGVLVGAACVAAVALLVKLAAISIAIPMLALAIGKYGRRGMLARLDLWAATLGIGLVTVAWYLHGYRISLVHPPYHYFGAGGLGLSSAGTYRTVLQYVAMADLTPVVVALALGGLMLGRGRADGWMFHWWLVGALVFVLPLTPRYHPWYALAFVPAVVGLAGA